MHRSLSALVALPFALALCTPSYPTAPHQWLSRRTNQCTWQLGYDRPASEPSPRLVITIKDVAYGDGKTCWLELTTDTGNPHGTPVIGCQALPSIHKAVTCRFTYPGWPRPPKKYRAANSVASINVRNAPWQWVTP